MKTPPEMRLVTARRSRGSWVSRSSMNAWATPSGFTVATGGRRARDAHLAPLYARLYSRRGATYSELRDALRGTA
ncbi:MAG: hypothetical protein ACKOHI_11120, partial [Phycisphaerales bacterium]